MRQLPATCPSTRNVWIDCGVFVLNTRDRWRSGRICVRRAWTSSVASHAGRKRTGAGVSASGSGARGTSSSSAPPSSRKRRSVIRLERRDQRPSRDAREAGDVRPGRRSERGEVALDEVVDPLLLGDRRRLPEPVRREPEQVGPRLLPGPERRYTDEVEPEPRAVPRRGVEAERRDDLGATFRSVGEEARGLPRRGGPFARRTAEAPDPTGSPVLADRGGEEPEVPPGRHVDRGPHHPGLHDRLPLQRSREVVAPEAVQPGPEGDVPRGGVLRLEAPDAFDRPGDVRAESLQEALSSEEGTVQLSLGQRSAGVGRSGHRGGSLVHRPTSGREICKSWREEGR